MKDWTKTALELWWSTTFIHKRLLEQVNYDLELIGRFEDGSITGVRYNELYSSSLEVRQRLQIQLDNIRFLQEDGIVLRNIGMRLAFNEKEC